MGARIEQISIEVMGPLRQLHWQLGDLNLVYGRNEQGKTLLVEFLIRSLFQQPGRQKEVWRLRPVEARGKVIVSGLAERPVSFTPHSSRRSKKLEDYLEQDYPGLPVNIGRLLAVRGGESSLVADHNPQSINRDILREYLSGRGMLDAIQDKIQKIVQRATIENHTIKGTNSGKIKTHNELRTHKQRIDELFVRLGEVYSGGPRRALQSQLEQLDKELESQRHAKQHQAYLLAQRVKQVETGLARWPQAEMDAVQSQWTSYQEQQKSITRQKQLLASLEEDSQHYQWLKQAIVIYEAAEGKSQANPILLVLGVAALLLSVLFSFLQIALGTAVMSIIAVALVWSYIGQLRQSAMQLVETAERQKIAEEFEVRFGQKLSGLPLLRQHMEKLEKAYYAAQTRQEELANAEDAASKLAEQIATGLDALTGEMAPPEHWAKVIPDLLKQQRALQEELANLKEELAALNVEPADYLPDFSGDAYDPAKMRQISTHQEKIARQLQTEKEALNNLKQRMCQETGDDISIAWEDLIQNLQKKCESIVSKYKQQTAQVLAEIVVSKVISTAREEEDGKIQRALQGTAVHKPIHFLTNRYHNIWLDGENLMLSDDYGEFALADLSTGAQEQVLLALRMGFAARLLGQESLFLILDDAFQHSDWQRRERLISHMVTMTEQGWQVIYFTMDDHIRDLFTQQAVQLGPKYQQFDLSAP